MLRFYCLVRADSEDPGLERIERGFRQAWLGGWAMILELVLELVLQPILELVLALRLVPTGRACELSAERVEMLGNSVSSDLIWNELADRVDTVYHCAAQVNNLASYDELRQANVVGTQEVARLAL
jgi:thioester reductase-like protein